MSYLSTPRGSAKIWDWRCGAFRPSLNSPPQRAILSASAFLLASCLRYITRAGIGGWRGAAVERRCRGGLLTGRASLGRPVLGARWITLRFRPTAGGVLLYYRATDRTTRTFFSRLSDLVEFAANDSEYS